MTVWDDLVGQHHVVDQLQWTVAGAQRALVGETGTAMTHAFLFTGPPGSGRSTAARAFAAALQCERGGCGECLACRTALAGSHADVKVLTTEKAQLTLEPTKDAVRIAALAPANKRWQVVIVEDADRLNDFSANALLKSIEEPPPRTVWLLCAPTVEDVEPTIRSRCRLLVLKTPSTEEVAGYLGRRDGIPSAIASFAARVSQGHIGRARALARDEAVRNRRREVLSIPTQLTDLGACMTSAANLIDAATEEAKPRSEAFDLKEIEDLDMAYGAGSRGVRATGYSAAKKELESKQKQRAKRMVKDSVDRSLIDLASFYRDVLCLQIDADTELVNEELRREIATMARGTTGAVSTQRLSAIFDTRELLEGEIAPLLALESLMISLRGGDERTVRA